MRFSAQTVLGIAALIFLFTLPLFASDFIVLQIGVQSLYLAILAMSLVFLAGYGGMVSLAQIGIFGVGGYTYANLFILNEQPLAVAIIAALILPVIVGFFFGLISIRTEGIYFLMITLALAMLTFTFALQNRNLTKGFSGITGVRPPTFGSFSLEDPHNFYYVSLVIALLIYLSLRYIVNTQFGLSLQAIRDNSRRMAALGYNVNAHRVAAFSLAAFVAGIAGILGVWYNGQMTPGSIDLARNINVLLITVMGGLLYFEGSFVGAAFFILVTTFASSFTTRFNTLIGIAFLLISLFLPNGIMGLLDTFLSRFSPKRKPDSPASISSQSSIGAEGS